MEYPKSPCDCSAAEEAFRFNVLLHARGYTGALLSHRNAAEYCRTVDAVCDAALEFLVLTDDEIRKQSNGDNTCFLPDGWQSE